MRTVAQIIQLKSQSRKKCLKEPLDLLPVFIHVLSLKYQFKNQGFPGGTVVRNLPANAGDTGLSPVLGRSHMLNPCATTPEPARLEPVLRNKRSHCNEKPAHHNEE